MKKVALSILMLGILTACASETPKEEKQQEAPAPAAEAPQPIPQKAPEPVAVDPLNDPNGILAKRSVYFPLDISVVQGADRSLVEAHAKYLAAHPGTKVRVEGNCDERGSNEYNLALGQRRAEGVKKLLRAGGAGNAQVETVSNGEEKPKLSCHAEKCWQENRRADMIYGR